MFLINVERFCNKSSFAKETYKISKSDSHALCYGRVNSSRALQLELQRLHIVNVPEIFPRCYGFPGHAGVLPWRVATPLLASEGWWWVGADEALSPQCGDLCPSSRHQAWPLPARLELNWRENGVRLRRSYPAAECEDHPHTPLALATAWDRRQESTPALCNCASTAAHPLTMMLQQQKLLSYLGTPRVQHQSTAL